MLNPQLKQQTDLIADDSQFEEISDRYAFVQMLGKGAQGIVFQAKMRSSDQVVAIKKLRIDSVRNWKEYELFRREANVLKTLNIHGVAKFYEAPEFLDANPPCAYIVQEYIRGESLESLMKRGRRFSMQQTLSIGRKLLDILEQLHKHSPVIVHRDIKPGNILMSPLKNGEFEPYLVDFGAVANPQVQKGGSTVAGTYGYMPPEQLMGNPVPASDIYAFAAMLAYMLSGVQPADMVTKDFRLIIEPHLEALPGAVTSTLREMLAPKIEDRLVDYDEIRSRFDAFIANRFVPVNSIGSHAAKPLNPHEIKRYGQRGNIEHWVNLSDSVPRKVPIGYLDIQRTLNTAEHSVTRKISFQPIDLLIWGVALSLILFFLWCGFYIMSREGVLAAIPMLLFSCVFLGAICYGMALQLNNPRILDARSRPPAFDEENRRILTLLIQQGTKAVATFIECSYVPMNSNYAEAYKMCIDGEHEKNYPKEYDACYYRYSPCFKVQYKFNPVDDDNPDVLVHEIIVHSPKDVDLKPGDPIPILYWIDPKNNRNVLSMPYPFPIEHIGCIRELYYSQDEFQETI